MDMFNQGQVTQQFQQVPQGQSQVVQSQNFAGNQNAFASQQQFQSQPNQTNQRLFTQDEVNAIVGQRVNSVNMKVQELTGQLNTLQNNANGYLSELTGLKQTSYLNSVGVPNGFADYVKFEASKLAVNGKSFEQAVSEFLSTPQGLQLSSLNGQVNQSQVAQQVQGANGVLPQGSVAGSQTTQVMQQLQSQALNQNTNVGANMNTGAVVNAGGVTQLQAQQMAQQTPQTVPNQQVVYGSTNFQVAGQQNLTNNVDSEVASFIASKYGKKA